MTQDDWTDGTFDPVCAGFGGVAWIKKVKLTGSIIREKSKELLDLASYLDIDHVQVSSMKYAEMCGGSWWPSWDLCGFEV